MATVREGVRAKGGSTSISEQIAEISFLLEKPNKMQRLLDMKRPGKCSRVQARLGVPSMCLTHRGVVLQGNDDSGGNT